MENLQREVQKMVGVQLSRRQVEALECYERELIEWNSRFNLTAIREPEGIRTKHFLDSLSCMLAIREAQHARLIDVGTGAGFPGIPLKIAMPSLHVTLVESVGKKAEFCRHITKTLNLQGMEVVQARAEEIGQMPKHREQYDWAVARAVASLPVLLEYLLPLSRIGGHVLAQKGESGPAEVHASDRALKLLGGQMQQLIPVTLPGVADERYLIVIRKTAGTPKQYPRRPGVPSKTPLVQ